MLGRKEWKNTKDGRREVIEWLKTAFPNGFTTAQVVKRFRELGWRVDIYRRTNGSNDFNEAFVKRDARTRPVVYLVRGSPPITTSSPDDEKVREIRRLTRENAELRARVAQRDAAIAQVLTALGKFRQRP